MEKLKEELKKEAKDLHGEISPCGRKESLDDCFIEYKGRLLFWFNVGENTKVLAREINN